LVPEVEENLERGAIERLQGINPKTHLPIKNSEFKKLLLKFNHGKKVCRTTKDRLQNGSNRIRRKAQSRTTKGGNKPETGTQIRSWGTDRTTKR
jgi:predicted amidophosphoribosyltransferase